MFAVFGSGISSMSEASIPFQPAIDDPSNAWPELNLSSSKCETGTVTCCSFPRVSEKRKSTNLTSFSFTIFITSATVLAAIKISPGWMVVEKLGMGCLMQFLCQSWCMDAVPELGDCPRSWSYSCTCARSFGGASTKLVLNHCTYVVHMT